MNTLFYDLGRKVVDELITSPINSKSGIKLSLDKPLNNRICLNIFRPAVLRQYYGKDFANIDGKLNVILMAQEQVHHQLVWIQIIL